MVGLFRLILKSDIVHVAAFEVLIVAKEHLLPVLIIVRVSRVDGELNFVGIQIRLGKIDHKT